MRLRRRSLSASLCAPGCRRRRNRRGGRGRRDRLDRLSRLGRRCDNDRRGRLQSSDNRLGRSVCLRFNLRPRARVRLRLSERQRRQLVLRRRGRSFVVRLSRRRSRFRVGMRHRVFVVLVHAERSRRIRAACSAPVAACVGWEEREASIQPVQARDVLRDERQPVPERQKRGGRCSQHATGVCFANCVCTANGARMAGCGVVWRGSSGLDDRGVLLQRVHLRRGGRSRRVSQSPASIAQPWPAAAAACALPLRSQSSSGGWCACSRTPVA